MQYCSFTASDLVSITSHIHNQVLFLLWLCLFILELFLHSSPVAYWAPTDLGSSSFSVLSFCLFILFMGFPRQECWSGLPFPSPVDHILSELFTMTRPSWVALHGMHSFIELDKAVVHVIRLVSFLWCDPMHYSLPGSSIKGIFQARILEWVAISFSRRSSWLRDQTWVSWRFFKSSHQWSPKQMLCCA